LQLYNYVTPASYLELNSIFKKLLQEKRESVENMRQMYQVHFYAIKIVSLTRPM
jgi:hypothetical protein